MENKRIAELRTKMYREGLSKTEVAELYILTCQAQQEAVKQGEERLKKLKGEE